MINEIVTMFDIFFMQVIAFIYVLLAWDISGQLADKYALRKYQTQQADKRTVS
jgi:hypothetical protein